MRIGKVAALVLGLVVLSASSGKGQDPAAGIRTERSPAPGVRILRGEALLVSKDAEVVIAVDEADEDGVTDGKLDHLLYMLVLDLSPYPFTIQDTFAEIEVRPASVRALLPTSGYDVRFRLGQTAEKLTEPLHLGLVLKRQEFNLGTELYEHRGEQVRELTFADIKQLGPQGVLLRLQPDLKAAIAAAGSDPFKPAPNPDEEGSGCSTTCSITCDTGSCSANCNANRCADCKCRGLTFTAPYCLCLL